MCEICHHAVCPAGCPNADGGGERCGVCGASVGGERAWHLDGVCVCDDCAPGLGADELCLLTGAADGAELLEMLGFVRY